VGCGRGVWCALFIGLRDRLKAKTVVSRREPDTLDPQNWKFVFRTEVSEHLQLTLLSP